MAHLYTQPRPEDRATHNLHEFVSRASRLCEEDESSDPFIRFALCGEYTDAGIEKQVFVDPIQNMVTDANHLRISRDYDSVLGISDKFMVDGPLNVWPVPHEKYALTTSIHLQYEIRYQGANHSVDYHRIPNFEFGTFGGRHHLNIFFPRLWAPDRRGVHLSQQQRNFWYIHDVDNLAHCIREKLQERFGDPFIDQNDVAWATDFFILHTIRGTKHTTLHHLDRASADYYLTEFLHDARLSAEVPEIGEWYIDVGIQISSERHECLQWMTGGHSTMLQEALHIPAHHADRISSINSSKYSRDPVSHLTAVSGFRVSPGLRARGRYEAVYVQAYTTDKTVTANTEGRHHAKYLTTDEAMGQQQPTRTIDGLYTLYQEAQTANSSSARLEVRVPLEFGSQVLLEFDHNRISTCLCAFPRDDWWSFRLIRLVAISKTLSLQARSRARSRLQPEALTLTAACVWLANSLHARPEDGPAARRLMDAVLPLTEAEGADLNVLAYNTSVRAAAEQEEEEESGDDEPRGRVPYNPYGCIFLRRLMIKNTPRLRYGGPVLSAPAFQFWFNNTLEDVTRRYLTSGVQDKNIVARERMTTNKRKLPTYVNWTGAPEPNLFEDLDDQERALQPVFEDVDSGSDMEERLSPPPDGPPDSANSFLSQLWRQFVVDITSKSPNPRGITKPSYLRLTTAERQSGKEDIYRTLHLPQVFRAVNYRSAPVDDWLRAFSWLFPEPGFTTTSGVQNYPSCPYFRRWMVFIEDPRNKEAAKAMRRQLFKRLREWQWIPDAQQDKMWPTTKLGAFTRWPADPSPETSQSAPRILLREHCQPIFEEEGIVDGDRFELNIDAL
ncbi:hypothetical protein LshimejAT787_4400010 [Lyophyllum shimeji]|uniref:Uncharacterized protein n=1 Tax=Lyophyllum shimeji TaxID=47721 RepID=A0A9P3Q3F6_LYOSH|nr:hypothetical protein LshimejAT787_4400010 [Lyophyllum shimeji]